MSFFASTMYDRDTRSLTRSASTSASMTTPTSDFANAAWNAKSKSALVSTSTGDRVGAVRGARPLPPRPPRGPAPTEFGELSSSGGGGKQAVQRKQSVSTEELNAELADMRLALHVYGGSDDAHSPSPGGLSPAEAYKTQHAGGSNTSLRAPSAGSRRASRSPHGSRTKTSTPTSASGSSAATRAQVQLTSTVSTPGPNTAVPLAHARSSPDLPQRERERTRSRPAMRTRMISSAAAAAEGAEGGEMPLRPPRGPRPPVSASPSPTQAVKGTPVRFVSESATVGMGMASPPFDLVETTPSPASAKSTSSFASETLAAQRPDYSSAYNQITPQHRTTQMQNQNQNHHDTYAYDTDYSRAHTPTFGAGLGQLAPPARTGYKSSGSASDGSYGSPLSDLGRSGFSVKRLLSKPASSSASPSGCMSLSARSSSGYASPTPGVRSEPDADLRRWGSASGGARPGPGALSDPEAMPPSFALTSASAVGAAALGSLGRARGREWGHVLRAGVGGHARSGSSSLDGPGEGANAPYSVRAPGQRPAIQLTTAAVRRLSALGAGVSGVGSPLDVREATGPSSAPPAVRPRASNSQPSLSPMRITHTTSASASAGTSPSSTAGASASTSGTRIREDSPPPPGLTPAEIVAHAYKQQEKRRAALAREAARGEADTVRVARDKAKKRDRERPARAYGSASTTPIEGAHAPTSAEKGAAGEVEDDDAGAYYTVLGNLGDRVVAIGSARDSAFGLFDGPAVGARGRVAAQAIVAEIAASAGPASVNGGGTRTSSEGERVVGGGPKHTEKENSKEHRDAQARPPQGTLRRKLTKKMSGPLRSRREGSIPRGDERDGGAVSELGEVLVVGASSEEQEKPRVVRPSLSLNTNTAAATLGITATASASASATSSNPLSVSDSRRSMTLPRERGGSAVARLRGTSPPSKASLDSYVAVGGSASGRGLPSAVNGFSPWLASERERERIRVASDASARGRPAGRSSDVDFGGAKGKDRDREREREKEHGKLWGLVKRISSNALKDRYHNTPAQSPPAPVPPVPVLPLSQSATPTIATRFDFEKSDDGHEDVEKGEDENEKTVGMAWGLGMGVGFGFGLSSTPKSSSNRKNGRPSTAPTFFNSSPSGMDDRLKQGTAPAEQLLKAQPRSPQYQQRPSTATRSSSPTLSSDLRSWDSFNQTQTQSSRSSASFTVNDAHAGAKDGKQPSPLGQYILAPEKFSMFDSPVGEVGKDGESERGRAPERHGASSSLGFFSSMDHDPLFYNEENAPQQALPVPPRRAANTPRYASSVNTSQGGDESSRSASPSIPSFSADNAINTFGLNTRGRSATAGTATTSSPAASEAFTGNDFGSDAVGMNKSASSATQPPPRPPRSALRTQSYAPTLPSTPKTAQSSSTGSSHSSGRPERASIGSHSQASTARPASGTSLAPTSPPAPSPASSSTPSLLPGDAQSPVSASSDARTTSSGGSVSASPASARAPGPRGGLLGGLKLGSGMGISKDGKKADAAAAARALTEKEKIDKWDELLDRSERAGGTLHVDLGGLLSDQMRDTVYESVRDSSYEGY